MSMYILRDDEEEEEEGIKSKINRGQTATRIRKKAISSFLFGTITFMKRHFDSKIMHFLDIRFTFYFCYLE